MTRLASAAVLLSALIFSNAYGQAPASAQVDLGHMRVMAKADFGNIRPILLEAGWLVNASDDTSADVYYPIGGVQAKTSPRLMFQYVAQYSGNWVHRLISRVTYITSDASAVARFTRDLRVAKFELLGDSGGSSMYQLGQEFLVVMSLSAPDGTPVHMFFLSNPE